MSPPRILLALTAALALGACKKDEVPEQEELGTFTTDTGGLTEDIPVDVSPDAQSVFIGCEWNDQSGDVATVWEIKKPDSSYFYVNQEWHPDAASAGNKPMRVGNHEEYLPILMPVSPQATLSQGAWSMRVWVATGGKKREVSCTKVERTAEVPSTALIDVAFVFVGIDGINAGNAEGNDAVQGLITSMGNIWADAGLGVGDVSYSDFGGDVNRFAVIDNDSTEPYDLYKTVPDDVGRTITIFLVQEITSGDGAIIEGVAAGPPGAATIGGTAKSGMIVAADSLADDASRVAQVAAHEGAHFLGLFHTTEKDGRANDPLSDTPACSGSDDANGDGRLAPSECGDGSNLMFWAPPADSANSLSDDQGWVLRRNPAAR